MELHANLKMIIPILFIELVIGLFIFKDDIKNDTLNNQQHYEIQKKIQN